LAGYDVQLAEGGAEGLEAVAQSLPDAVVLDLGMPDIDGLEVCRRLRLLGNRVPILILTARDAVEDRIDGLDVGADDYMVKPFDLGELQARLRALLRRAAPDGDGSLQAPAFAEVALDPGRHGAVVGRPAVDGDTAAGAGVSGAAVRDGGGSSRFVELTRTEYQLLELFLRNPRQVLTHGVIYERVWGYDFGPTSNALRVYVGYLRRKLDQAGARPLIHNVRGVGYVLREP
jgi:two-component system response regulator MprA